MAGQRHCRVLLHKLLTHGPPPPSADPAAEQRLRSQVVKVCKESGAEAADVVEADLSSDVGVDNLR